MGVRVRACTVEREECGGVRASTVERKESVRVCLWVREIERKREG